MTTRRRWVGFVVAIAVAGLAAPAGAADLYVSAARGKGKVASKEQPAKDLGNIASQLQDGDVVHIAQGTYLGKGENGSDSIGVAVKIIGGYDDDFAKRDPWGAHRTILTGTQALSGSTDYRLIIDATKCQSEIGVDGVIVDNGPRNRYAGDQSLLILRKADMAKDQNATPESGGIKIKIGKGCSATVQNNVVMNTAPTGGALAVWGNEGTRATIRNNLVINNTGEGIFAMTQWHPRDGKKMSEFLVEANTVLFNWKHDAIATYGGNGLKMDNDLVLTASGNVFGFGDYGGVDNIKKAKGLTLKVNLFAANKLYDYREFNTAMTVDKLEDEAELLTKESAGNLSQEFKVPVGEKFATVYAGRVEISRAKVDAAAKVENSGANALRGMLGLPLQANAVKIDADVWLPRLDLDDALRVGEAKILGKYGCQKPASE